jgi:carbamate kinase
MIGMQLDNHLESELPGREVTTLLTQVLVRDPFRAVCLFVFIYLLLFFKKKNFLRRFSFALLLLFLTHLSHFQVDLADPAFTKPTKPIGPSYPEFRQDLAPMVQVQSTKRWRKVVASPKPKKVMEINAIKVWLMRTLSTFLHSFSFFCSSCVLSFLKCICSFYFW